jgi:hypothetical protein
MTWQPARALASAAAPIQGGSDEIVAYVEATFHIHDRPQVSGHTPSPQDL